MNHKTFNKIDLLVRCGLALIVVALSIALPLRACRSGDELDTLGTARKPLVMIAGQTQQIPTADYVSSPGGMSLNGTAASGAGDMEATTLTTSGAANFQTTTRVERILNTNDAPSITCDGGTLHPTTTGGEHMGHIVPAVDTTTCQVRFAHPPAACLCSLATNHVEVATGIGRSCTILNNDLTVTAAPSWALGTFDYSCSSQN